MRRSGARDFHFEIDTGRGSFLPGDGQALDPLAVQQATREAGFELLELGARVRGVLERGQEGPRLQTPAGEVFSIVEGTSEEERKGFAMLAEWLMDGGGQTVAVRGGVHAHAGGPPGLTVREFRVIEDGG